MKALVIGSNGYLGRHITRMARDMGWVVSTSDLQENAWDCDPGYRQCDIRRKEDLRKLDWRVDHVYFFSGILETTDSFERYEACIDINEKGLVGALEAIRVRADRLPKIIFPSSRLVYLGGEGVLGEDSEANSLTLYSVNKRAAEMYLKLYEQVFGLPFTIFRICVPYGNLLGGECGAWNYWHLPKICIIWKGYPCLRGWPPAKDFHSRR